MKSNLLLISLLFSPFVIYSQLSVKPAGTSDTYIYVKDELLFVKEDIHLESNPTATTNASIYLRDGGQLLQEGAVSNNSGDGFLSVIQTTNPTNAYAYYYWGAMVGNPALGGGTPGNKNFGVGNIYQPLNGPLGIVAQPAATTTAREGIINPLTISTRWLYHHMTPGTEAAGAYTRMNTNYSLQPGFGFTMKGVGIPSSGMGHEQMYEFRGRPHSGDFQIPVLSEDVNGEAMMTLAGNPYPSALDLNRVWFDPDNSGKIKQILFYDEDRSAMNHTYSGKPYGYGIWVPGIDADLDGLPGDATYNPGLYTSAPFFIYNEGGSTGGGSVGTGAFRTPRLAAIGQGFMLVGTAEGTTPDYVTIKNSHRRFIRDNSLVMHKSANSTVHEELARAPKDPKPNATFKTFTTVAEAMRTPQTRFYVTFDNNVTRDLLLVFSNDASDSFDVGIDAVNPFVKAKDAAFPILDNQGRKIPHVINGTDFGPGKRIPLSFTLNQPGRVMIKVAEEVNAPYTEMYLYDALNETYKQLHYKQSRRGVPLNLTSGKHDDRFYIVFEKVDVLPWRPSVNAHEFRSNVHVFQNNNQRQLEIRNPNGYEIKTLTVYDMTGKQVLHKNNLGKQTTHSFYSGNLSDGVYIVKIQTVDDQLFDYKALVHN
ncbi:MAG: T9SS type A sorting domain-containing protein [Bacteroidetes bacterium]|nr:T9SS type A sorting domain-containing protein [Bacteroidota bacterium]